MLLRKEEKQIEMFVSSIESNVKECVDKINLISTYEINPELLDEFRNLAQKNGDKIRKCIDLELKLLEGSDYTDSD